MNILLRFLDKYEGIIYFLLGVIVFLFLRRLFKAWKDWRSALFGIEKENSQARFNQSLSILIFCAFVALGLFIITTFVTPAVPGLEEIATPTIDLTAQATIEEGIAAQVTQTTTGLIPTLESFFEQGCIPGQIAWMNPVEGDTVSGSVSLEGTVNVTDLGYYKYEYALAGSDSWTTIAAGNSKVEDGALGGTWDTSELTPGDYQLKLDVFSHDEDAYPECKINITIAAP